MPRVANYKLDNHLEDRSGPERAPLLALFIGFLKVSFFSTGGGGGIVFARRLVVEQRCWMDNRDFAEILSLCQFMPGPQPGRGRGLGRLAVAGNDRGNCQPHGLHCDPLNDRFPARDMVSAEHSSCHAARYFGGVSAAAAGLVIGTGLRLLAPYRDHPMALLFAALAFGGLVFTKLPLLIIVIALAPLSVAIAAISSARGNEGSVTPVSLTLYFALLSSISIGGMASVLPDIRDYVVGANGGLSDAEFANFFAIAQILPGPNFILMMTLIGWRVCGVSTAIAVALATLGPPCAMYYLAFRLWNRFRLAPWQRAARRGLIPVTIGLITGGGTVMAHVAGADWQRVIVTMVAAALLLGVRINPLWILAASGTAGAVGFL